LGYTHCELGKVRSHAQPHFSITGPPILLAPRKREEKENYASSKKLLTSIKEKGPLHQKRKGGVSEDQEGCGQTSLQTSPD